MLLSHARSDFYCHVLKVRLDKLAYVSFCPAFTGLALIRQLQGQA